MKKFAITVTPRMLRRPRLVRASRSPARSSAPTDERASSTATRATFGTHISSTRATHSTPAMPKNAVPTPARPVMTPPSSCPAARPDASAIVSQAMAPPIRCGPTMSSSSARRLVMSTTQPMPANSRNGYSSHKPSCPARSASPTMTASGISSAVCQRTVRRRSKRSEMTPPMAPPSSSGAHMTVPVSCTSRGEPVTTLTWYPARNAMAQRLQCQHRPLSQSGRKPLAEKGLRRSVKPARQMPVRQSPARR